MAAGEAPRCVIDIDGYRFDFDEAVGRAAKLGVRRVVVEAPQGFVRLLPRLASFLEECMPGVEVLPRLEPSYGLCSLSISALGLLGDSMLVHIGHEFYPYPLCWGGRCGVSLQNVVVVPGVYLGGDPGRLAGTLASILEEGAGVVLGYTAQHRPLARSLSEMLRSSGVRVLAVEPVVGCYYNNLVRDDADYYVVLASGGFHVLGLALTLYARGLESQGLLAADPYTGRVRDYWPEAMKTIARRLWLMKRFAEEAGSVGVIVGLLPGQYRPGVVDAVVKMLRRHGRRVQLLLAERLSREYLDNLSPSEFDAYIVSSCPRLAIEDFADYWKPVLAPGEARAALSGERYGFPW